MQVTIDTMVKRWTDPTARPLFKGNLISPDGSCCAQGDVLRVCGWSDKQLYHLGDPTYADKAVAEALGISRFQAVLLRLVNDEETGCPQDIFAHPERVIGDSAQTLLAFGRYLDQDRRPRSPVSLCAGNAKTLLKHELVVETAAVHSVGYRIGKRVTRALELATWGHRAPGVLRRRLGAAREIMGAEVLRFQKEPFLFLPLFGFADPEAVLIGDNYD